MEPETEALLIENDVDSSEFSDEVQLNTLNTPLYTTWEGCMFRFCLGGRLSMVVLLWYCVCCSLSQVNLNSSCGTGKVLEG